MAASIGIPNMIVAPIPYPGNLDHGAMHFDTLAPRMEPTINEKLAGNRVCNAVAPTDVIEYMS